MIFLDTVLVGLVIGLCLFFVARALRGGGCRKGSCGMCPGASSCLRGKVKK